MDDFQVDLLHPTHSADRQPPRRKNVFLLAFFVIILVVGGFWVVRQSALAIWPNDPTIYDPITLKPKNFGIFQSVKNFIFTSNNILQGEQNDRINILVLGIGGPGHEGPYLSDTNIIVSIKPSTKEVALISIPRDLGVAIEGQGIRRINFADAVGESKQVGGGGDFARTVFSKTFGLDIPYYVRIDFTAFRDIIDIVDGVTVDVARPFTDTQFPGPNFSYQTIDFAAGTQTLQGERALQYARSRHGNNGEGSDFARARRQQQVIKALKEKLLSAGTYTNPVRVKQIFDALSTHITTNLDFGQMMYLAGVAREADISNSKALTLDDGPNGYLMPYTADSGAFMLTPKTNNFTDIQNAIAHIFDNNPPPRVMVTTTAAHSVAISTSTTSLFPAAHIEIQNGTWQVGLGSRTRDQLIHAGFSIASVGNSYHRPIASSTIFILNPKADKEVIKALAQKLVLPIAPLPDWLTEAYDDPATIDDESGPKFKTDSDILILLGDDFHSL